MKTFADACAIACQSASLAALQSAFPVLLGAINMGRRYATLDVVGDTLLITQKSLFGVKPHQVASAAIASIVIGHGGMEVNDRPIMELQIHPHGFEGREKTLRLLPQRAEEELDWIADELHRALSLSRERGSAHQE